MELYEETHIKKRDREEEKEFIDKRADVFIVSVLIVIIDFRLFICINNMKCN
jgi:hypothetical protein